MATLRTLKSGRRLHIGSMEVLLGILLASAFSATMLRNAVIDHSQLADHRLADVAGYAAIHWSWSMSPRIRTRTGGRRIVDAAGQVEKFHRRYGKR